MKKCAIFLVFLCLVPFVMVGCGKQETPLTSYTMDLEYDNAAKVLSGSETVQYINTSNNVFSALYFHLYANAFRQDAINKPVAQSNHEDAYPNGVDYGDIMIGYVRQNNMDLSFTIGGADKNILEVQLPNDLYPNESIVLEIAFTVQLANINHRLGFGDKSINFGNFYPIACVYDEGNGFMTKPYSSNGDPFYSDVANYSVRITYPANLKLASSGVVERTTSQDGKTVSYITGKKIRDFCFVLSEDFKVETTTIDGIKINYFYYHDQNATHSLQTAADAVETFNDMIGSYPYPVLNVVETNFVHGGMEYPNLVMISDQCASQDDYEYVIIHEIAHQWWYGVVGNNEYSHAWQDEGLTEFTTLLFYQANISYDKNFDEMIRNTIKSYKTFVDVYTKINGKVETAMDRDLNAFDTEPEYVQCTYTKGVIMFHTMREMVGERKFKKALKEYYKQYAYQNATPAEMIACFSRATGYDLEGYFNSWLQGEAIVL